MDETAGMSSRLGIAIVEKANVKKFVWLVTNEGCCFVCIHLGPSQGGIAISLFAVFVRDDWLFVVPLQLFLVGINNATYAYLCGEVFFLYLFVTYKRPVGVPLLFGP